MTEDDLQRIAADYILEYGRRQIDDFTIVLNFGHVVNKPHREQYVAKVRQYIKDARVTIKIGNLEVTR